MKRFKKLSDDEILSEVRYQSSQASGSEFAADELVTDRTEALKYYLGKPRGDEIEGRSTVISKDVADMIDAMMTQIMPTFSSDDIVQFEAQSEQDEEQARLESQFCNYVVMEKNHGFILLETLVKDALLSKNCTAKVFVDVKETVEKERYKGLTPEEMLFVIQPEMDNQEVFTTMFDEETGKVNLKRVTTVRKLCVEAVAPENFAVTSEHKSQFLDDCTYCVERLWKTKSQLIEEGYDKNMVAMLPATTSDTKADSLERNLIDDESNFFNRDLSMQLCALEEHYIRIDQDGDGVAELHKVVTCENNLLSNEEVECVPYANGVAFLLGHRYYGQSVYDKIKEVQDQKTHFLRQWADNALVHNHKKYVAVEDMVNMDDLLNGRPNGVVRVNDTNAVVELSTSDIGPSCEAAMNYYDKIRTERSGSSLDLQSNQVSMPSNVGDAGVTTLVENLERVTALVTRNLSETLVQSMYRLVHKYMRLYFPEEMTAKINGKWANTQPQMWLEREQVNVSLPPTPSEKIRQQVALEKAIMMAKTEMEMGKNGITTDDAAVYQLKLDHMRLSGIDSPERYLIDPESPQAMQVAQMNVQQQMAEQQKQEQIFMQQQQAQMMLQNEMLKAQILEVQRNWENDKEELQFKYTELQQQIAMDKYKTDVNADSDEAKTVADSVTKLELKRMDREKFEDSAEMEENDD